MLLVIVDTEEEFPWDQPFSRMHVGTTAISAQRGAHERIYDRLGIVPTYVVDWPVATTPTAYEPLRALMLQGRCEVGTHLHPWVSPPHQETISAFNSFTGNLSTELEFEKLRLLTEAIALNFGRRPTTFKAGRYGVGPSTAATLARLGYRVDASVVPYTSFKADSGPDFSSFTEKPYWFETLGKRMLELPVTTGFHGLLRKHGQALYPMLANPAMRCMRVGAIASRLGLLERIRLTPEGCSAQEMKRIARTLVNDGCQAMTLTYHSPSLSPGQTPYVKSLADLESFLSAINDFCTFFQQELGGIFMSTTELYAAFESNVEETA
ncbi:MAG: hypothetical protein NVSMB6_10030 [Burkholderiaceae bacterium]